MLAGYRQDFAGFLRCHCRRPWHTVQQGHFTKEIRGVQYTQNHFIAMLIFDSNLDQPTLKDVECTAWIIDVDNGGVSFVVLFTYYTRELLELFIIKLREQWDLFEKIDIRHHDFPPHP